jgi:hypothetical protein
MITSNQSLPSMIYTDEILKKVFLSQTLQNKDTFKDFLYTLDTRISNEQKKKIITYLSIIQINYLILLLDYYEHYIPTLERYITTLEKELSKSYITILEETKKAQILNITMLEEITKEQISNITDPEVISKLLFIPNNSSILQNNIIKQKLLFIKPSQITLLNNYLPFKNSLKLDFPYIKPYLNTESQNAVEYILNKPIPKLNYDLCNII